MEIFTEKKGLSLGSPLISAVAPSHHERPIETDPFLRGQPYKARKWKYVTLSLLVVVFSFVFDWDPL